MRHTDIAQKSTLKDAHKTVVDILRLEGYEPSQALASSLERVEAGTSSYADERAKWLDEIRQKKTS